MHNASTTLETLAILWNNYLTLAEQVDLESMSAELLDWHVEQNSSVRPFRIAAWVARQGYFVAAWALWEYYSRQLSESLPNQCKKTSKESTVQWLGRAWHEQRQL